MARGPNAEPRASCGWTGVPDDIRADDVTLTITHRADDGGDPVNEPLGKFGWQKLILSLDIAPHTKLVALAFSIYANRDGNRAHPGNLRLRLELRLSRATVLRHVTVLRDDLRLIERTLRVRAGRPGRGRHAKADVYRLVIPTDLPDR